jgi:hypothetical protein
LDACGGLTAAWGEAIKFGLGTLLRRLSGGELPFFRKIRAKNRAAVAEMTRVRILYVLKWPSIIQLATIVPMKSEEEKLRMREQTNVRNDRHILSCIPEDLMNGRTARKHDVAKSSTKRPRPLSLHQSTFPSSVHCRIRNCTQTPKRIISGSRGNVFSSDVWWTTLFRKYPKINRHVSTRITTVR